MFRKTRAGEEMVTIGLVVVGVLALMGLILSLMAVTKARSAAGVASGVEKNLSGKIADSSKEAEAAREMATDAGKTAEAMEGLKATVREMDGRLKAIDNLVTELKETAGQSAPDKERTARLLADLANEVDGAKKRVDKLEKAKSALPPPQSEGTGAGIGAAADVLVRADLSKVQVDADATKKKLDALSTRIGDLETFKSTQEKKPSQALDDTTLKAMIQAIIDEQRKAARARGGAGAPVAAPKAGGG